MLQLKIAEAERNLKTLLKDVPTPAVYTDDWFPVSMAQADELEDGVSFLCVAVLKKRRNTVARAMHIKKHNALCPPDSLDTETGQALKMASVFYE